MGTQRSYIYGLERVELRARNHEIGNPYGLYLPDEKVIILYSLPLTWELPHIGLQLGKSLQRFYAEIESYDNKFVVTWPGENFMGVWFLSYVLAHELGHHYIEQYKTKNGAIPEIDYEEIVADMHGDRISEKLFKVHREKKLKQAKK